MTSSLSAAAQSMIDALMDEIRLAFENNDFDRAAQAAAAAKQVQTALSKLTPSPKAGGQAKGNVSFAIVVTAGALKHQYLTVKEPLKKGVMKADQPIKVKLGDGPVFETKAFMKYYRLQERSNVGAFYESERIHEGDTLVCALSTDDVWIIQKA